jgi:hypothetical protein
MLQGKPAFASAVRVLGYSVMASKDIHGGYAYSGPPTGFVAKGRNLLFLRQTVNPGEFEIAVPIYETAIRLADSRPHYPNEMSATSVRVALLQEFEAALVQFDEHDLADIYRILDLLGNAEGIAELSRFSKTVPLPIQRDIAVSLLARDQLDYEPITISLLIDTSVLQWKRANAAGALGEHERNAHYLTFGRLNRNLPQMKI